MQTEQSSQGGKPRSGFAWIILGIVLLVLGAAGGAAGIIFAVSSAGQDSQRAVFPGEHAFSFDEAGTYTITHEHRSVVGGRTITSPESLPSAHFQLWSEDGEREVDLMPIGGTYTYHMGSYEGVGMFTVRIDDPGRYVLRATYQDGSAQPEFVLAIFDGMLLGGILVAVFSVCGGAVVAFVGLAFIIVGIVRLLTTGPR